MCVDRPHKRHCTGSRTARQSQFASAQPPQSLRSSNAACIATRLEKDSHYAPAMYMEEINEYGARTKRAPISPLITAMFRRTHRDSTHDDPREDIGENLSIGAAPT